jgi:hypothetical protein
LTWINTACGLYAALLRRPEASSNAHIGFDDFTTGIVLTAGLTRAHAGSIGEKAMRFILALGLLTTLCGFADATTVRHAHPRHAIVRPNYAPLGPPIHYRAAPHNQYYEPYYGASQGYAPGEKQQFIDSVRRFM